MQMESSLGFSASLELNGLPVLVCGGGPAALSVIRRLLDSGAVVTVVAADIGATVADLAARGLLIMRRRPPTPDDFTGATLVVPATGFADRDRPSRRPLAIMVCRPCRLLRPQPLPHRLSDL